jgi:transposase
MIGQGATSDLERRRGRQPAAGRCQSGKTGIAGNISRCGDELARAGVIEAAHSLIVRWRK